MNEKLEELISLLYQDNLTQYGKRLLVENIEKLQKENEKLKTRSLNILEAIVEYFRSSKNKGQDKGIKRKRRK